MSLSQYAQELLSTFSMSLGEVALIPATGGTFTVTITDQRDTSIGAPGLENSKPWKEPLTLWDRKADGGFPDVKHLKQRVRDVIEPGRDLGHVDRHSRSVPDEQGSVQSSHLSFEQNASTIKSSLRGTNGEDEPLKDDNVTSSATLESGDVPQKQTEQTECQDCEQ